MLSKLLLVFLFQSSSAVIYELNDSDYALMPPVFHLDDYEECFEDPEGLYCNVDFALVSDEPNPLLTMMHEYSKHVPTHYNHTLLRHGICITRTCKKFYEGNLRSTLEACYNESLYDKYKLKVRVSDGFDCSKYEKNQPIDCVDIAVGVVCVAILIINVVASIFDYFFEKGRDQGLRFLYCFSIFRNWEKLIAPPTEGREPRLQVLKGLHGIRVLTMALVITGHAFISSVIVIKNPEFTEDLYITRPVYILLNGTLIMQTFLMISSFLLVYNWLIYSEKHEPSWKLLPKQFFVRWLRLTPSYAIILALTASWFGRLTSGPYWQKIVGKEMVDCRRDWWKHLLYINNYVDNSECMVQSWYLAADTQLYYMAAIVFVMCRTVRSRKVVLSLLFVVGLIVPVLHTYYQNLDGVLIISPEFAQKLFMNDPTFNEVYKRGHTNLTGYVTGMAIGYMIYDWQKAGGEDTKRLRKYRYLFWTLFPIDCLCCYTGSIFYTYSPPPSFFVNLLFAALMKPIFVIITGSIIAGVIIQFEGLYRKVLEWHVWTIPSRLSFSAYLLHIALIRNHLAMQTAIYKISILVITLRCFSILVSSLIAAFFFWMLVEAPFGNIIREFFSKPESMVQSEKVDKDSKKTNDAKKINENLTKKEVANLVDKNSKKMK